MFARHGYHQSTVAKIAREAGVADGTIYLYFKNKDDILVQFFKYKTKQVFERFREEVDCGGSAVEKLRNLVRRHLEEFQRDRDLAIVYQTETHRLTRRAEEQIENFLLPDPTIRVLNTLLHAIDTEPEGPLHLSPLELSNRTALDLERVKAVVRQLEDRGYLSAGDQTITIRDAAALRQLHDLLALKEDVRNGLSCR